ncbi:hypothetical protein GQ600_5865 [Phytophthora cactorum]|nr:hypothetical protein GQ600_5865 [Phytophthora cactorum]
MEHVRSILFYPTVQFVYLSDRQLMARIQIDRPSPIPKRYFRHGLHREKCLTLRDQPIGRQRKASQPSCQLRLHFEQEEAAERKRPRRYDGSGFVLPGTTAQPLHHQYESRLSGFRMKMQDAPSSNYQTNIYSDRFIPSRLTTKLDTGFGLTADSPVSAATRTVTTKQIDFRVARCQHRRLLWYCDSNSKNQGAQAGTSSPYSMMLKRGC